MIFIIATILNLTFHQVEKIEAEKLKAVGLRNKVAALEEVRDIYSYIPPSEQRISYAWEA